MGTRFTPVFTFLETTLGWRAGRCLHVQILCLLLLAGLSVPLGAGEVYAQVEELPGVEEASELIEAAPPGPEILVRGPATLYTDRGNPVAVERLTLRVPARRGEPRAAGESSGETRLTFTVWRIPGEAGAAVAPIYLLPDWTARHAAQRYDLHELLATAAVLGPDADIYIVEPRGLAETENSFACPGTFGAPLSRRVDRAELAQLSAAYLTECVAWWQEAGMDLDAYTLPAMAADVLDVARVLEHTNVEVVGVGMGAFVALYAAQVEDSPLARAVLLRPPGIYYPVVSPQSLDGLWGALARRAAVAPTLYNLVPDLDGLLARVSVRLRASPIAATVVDPQTGAAQVVVLGVDDLYMALGEALAAGEAPAVPRRVFEMAQGNFQWLGEVTLNRRRAVSYDLAAVTALCHAAPVGLDLEALLEQGATGVLGEGAFQMMGEVCAPLQAQWRTIGDIGLAMDFSTVEIPVLFVTGTLDGRASALEVNAVATQRLLIDDLLIENWTGRLDADFWRQSTSILRAFLANNYEAIPLVSTALDFAALTARPFDLPAWQADYYANATLTGDPVVSRTDPRLDFEWGEDVPDPALAGDAFSVRWSQQVELPAGIYRFYAWSDDGARLWIDNVLVLDAWQEGPLRAYTVDVNLVQGLHDIRYEYFDAGGNALARLRTAYVTAYPDWVAAYYPNIDLTGEPVVVRNEITPQTFWGANAPAPGVPGGNFSARYTTQLTLEPGAYAFRITANGGVRLYLDDELVIDAWENLGRRLLEVNRVLEGTVPTQLRLEYFVAGGSAELNAAWLQRPAPQGPRLAVTGPTRAATDEAVAFSVASTPEGARQVTGILWDMGDRTQYGGAQDVREEILHTYAAPGIYDVTVVVTDSGNIASGLSRQIRIDDVAAEPESRGPVADFRGPSVIEAGMRVEFDGGESLGLNPIVRYRWDFGDGTRSDAAWVQKVYQQPGVYNVRLRVEDDQGLWATRSRLVLVLAEPVTVLPLRAPMPQLAFETPQGPIVIAPNGDNLPEAVAIAIVAEQAVLFEVEEDGTLSTTLPANQSIVLDARPSLAVSDERPITGFLWDIADGFSTTSDPVIELVFAAPGAYQVVLTVTDADGAVSMRRIVLNVVE